MKSFAIASLTLVAGAAGACCAVSPTASKVVFGAQTNIIVWDEKTQTEHFIRNANFTSDARDFGFIAPSPSRPTLSEASKEAFITLAALKPETLHEGATAGAEPTRGLGSVEVIQQVDVAGYHATTLLASDSKALAEWMKKNGYATSPAVQAWTQTYITRGWYLTAFKVANRSRVASTGTVRMSFRAVQPFNPFYVPKDNIGSSRPARLRLYFVADGRYEGTVGHLTPWVRPLWSAQVPDASAAKLAQELKLPRNAIPVDATVTTFSDWFPIRAADDVYFSRESDSILIPSVLAGGIALTSVGVFGWRRRKA